LFSSHHYVSLFLAWPLVHHLVFMFFTWPLAHCCVFLFLAWPRCINVCFCSLFGLSALLGVSVPCSAWVHYSNVSVPCSTLVHCLVFLFLVQLECIVGCFCFLLDFNALPYVSIICLAWMHCRVFLLLIQL
jgi:hypothetical protein